MYNEIGKQNILDLAIEPYLIEIVGLISNNWLNKLHYHFAKFARTLLYSTRDRFFKNDPFLTDHISWHSNRIVLTFWILTTVGENFAYFV